MSAPKRIVVADDDPDIRRLVVLKLTSAGHEVTAVGDGAAALEAIRRDPPDLAVLDVMMPGMTGVEVCVALRGERRTAGVPVILLTIFWKKFNTTGAVTGMLVGLISAVVLVLLSPNVLTGPSPAPPATPIIPIDPLFPLKSPALISVPLGFLGCYLGTILGGRGAEREREQGLQVSYDEIRVRANTGFSNIEEEIKEAAPEAGQRTS